MNVYFMCFPYLGGGSVVIWWCWEEVFWPWMVAVAVYFRWVAVADGSLKGLQFSVFRFWVFFGPTFGSA